MHHTFSSFFLVCFLFGVTFTALSLLTGAAHISLPGGHGGHAGHGGSARSDSISPLNLGVLLAFVLWFGGAGYLLRRFTPTPLLLVVLVAVVAGLAGAALVLLFLTKVLAPAQTVTDPEAYRLEGTQARVTAGIPASGTGEIIYSKAGTRRSDAARNIEGAAIGRNEKVVILRYHRGTAYVQTLTSYLQSSAREVAERLAAIEQSVSDDGAEPPEPRHGERR